MSPVIQLPEFLSNLARVAHLHNTIAVVGASFLAFVGFLLVLLKIPDANKKIYMQKRVKIAGGILILSAASLMLGLYVWIPIMILVLMYLVCLVRHALLTGIVHR